MTLNKFSYFLFVNKFLKIKIKYFKGFRQKQFVKHMSSNQNEGYTLSTKISSSSSFINKRVSPTTMQQVILMLKKQLRQCKIQRQQQKQAHKQQVCKYSKELQSLRQKILQIKQREYLKTILNEDAQDQKIKQVSLSNSNKQLKLYAQKLQNDLKIKNEQIQRLNEKNMDLVNDKQILIRQKQKHLQLSIIEKINLQQRIQVLQRQIQSKDNFLKAIKEHNSQSTNKQIKLKKLERKLIKKMNEVDHYEQQMRNYKQFETHKLLSRIDTLQKQNRFLKQHINKIQQQFEQSDKCLCSSNDCKKQISMFKNKYINKSRQLSKVKVQLSKQMFKQQFMKDIKSKQNILLYLTNDKQNKQNKRSDTRSRINSVKNNIISNNNNNNNKSNINNHSNDNNNNRKYDYGLTTNNNNINNKKSSLYSINNNINNKQNTQDIILFKLTENDQQPYNNIQTTIPNSYSLNKYKSQILNNKNINQINQYR